jgi:hypothetical protein
VSNFIQTSPVNERILLEIKAHLKVTPRRNSSGRDGGCHA